MLYKLKDQFNIKTLKAGDDNLDKSLKYSKQNSDDIQFNDLIEKKASDKHYNFQILDMNETDEFIENYGNEDLDD